MAYSKTTWEDLPSTNTPITASNLNNIENQVDANTDDIADLTSDISTLTTNYNSLLKPYVIFEETATLSTLASQTSLTLTDNVANYSYVEIYYCRFGANAKMTKYIPSKMNTATLDMILYVNNVFRTYTTTLQFVGTTANLINKAFANNFGTPSAAEANIVVYRIVGYK